MRHIALAFAFAFAASADWGLVTPDTTICAKDRASCELAREAIRRGWLRDWPAEAQCVPLPGCFTPESECIEGFNCR